MFFPSLRTRAPCFTSDRLSVTTSFLFTTSRLYQNHHGFFSSVETKLLDYLFGCILKNVECKKFSCFFMNYCHSQKFPGYESKINIILAFFVTVQTCMLTILQYITKNIHSTVFDIVIHPDNPFPTHTIIYSLILANRHDLLKLDP